MATGVVIAVLVDVVRLGVYGTAYLSDSFATLPAESAGLVLAATLSAFLGAYIGKRVLRKVTLRAVQLTVAGLMTVVGVGMATGLL